MCGACTGIIGRKREREKEREKRIDRGKRTWETNMEPLASRILRGHPEDYTVESTRRIVLWMTKSVNETMLAFGLQV